MALGARRRGGRRALLRRAAAPALQGRLARALAASRPCGALVQGRRRGLRAERHDAGALLVRAVAHARSRRRRRAGGAPRDRHPQLPRRRPLARRPGNGRAGARAAVRGRLAECLHRGALCARAQAAQAAGQLPVAAGPLRQPGLGVHAQEVRRRCAMTADERSGFLQRWSRRKAEAREAGVRDDELPDQPLPEAADAAVPVPAGEASEPAEPPPPTLDDVRAVTPDSDFATLDAHRAAVRGGRLAPAVKNAALKNLSSDPHYSVMDGLDTYIDDYSKLEPLPAPLLRRLVSARTLALFDDEADPPAAAGPSAA